jgi:hypothetical protein
MNRNFIIILLLSSFACLAKTDSYLGIIPFKIQTAPDNTYAKIHYELFTQLNFELLPQGIKPLLLESDSVPQECVAIITGAIDTAAENTVCRILIKTTGQESNEETKTINLRGMDMNQLVNILALKVRHFLESNVSGRVRISSMPLDCIVFLDGIKIGRTPAELTLEQGCYNVRLEGDNLYPWKDSICVTPGKEVAIQGDMKFHGFNTRPWFYSSVAATLLTAGAWFAEEQFHSDYLDLARGTPQSTFNKYYDRYRTVNYVRIVLLNSAIMGWIITSYEHKRNRSLQKKIFNR